MTVQRALDIFSQPEVWKAIVERGMKEDFSWQRSAKKYMEVYSHARRKRGF